ncbi:MAG: heavy metal-responsive transcriptional regulator [Pseudomonadales bacterium]
MSLLKIGAVAKLTGLSVQGIRYYQQLGLIHSQQRTQAGYRLFPPDTLAKIHFIQRCQRIGFSLPEITDMLNLQDTPSAGAAQVKQKVEDKIALIQQKIDDLEEVKHSLAQLSNSCSGRGSLDECPIYETLWRSDTPE